VWLHNNSVNYESVKISPVTHRNAQVMQNDAQQQHSIKSSPVWQA